MDYEKYQDLKVTVDEDGVATIVLNRPQRRNAFTLEMHAEFAELLPELEQDEAVRAIVLTGADKWFTVGADVQQGMTKWQGRSDSVAQIEAGQARVLNGLLGLSKPLICGMNGDAIGYGATLALLCDIVIASENARIGDTHVKRGLMGHDGGCIAWALRVGIGRAKRYLLTGDLLGAREAERIGLIEEVVPEGQAYAAALAMAKRLAKGAPLAVRFTKRTINLMIRQEVPAMFDAASGWAHICMTSDDWKEGAASFAERREPRFQGR